MQKQIIIAAILGVLLLPVSGCSASPDINIVKKPVIFDQEREQLSLQYLKERHDIDTDKAVIDPKMIVVHYTVIPTLEGTMRAFNEPKLPDFRVAITGASSLNVSSQFVVDRDGTIYQILPEETTFARHVIGLNYCAFGIENVGGDENTPLTDAQLNANIELIKYLKNKYPEVEYLIGHQEANQFRDHPLFKETDPNYRTEKSDPGTAFMEQLRDKLAPLKLSGAPQ
ncbi:peptidoglycan recognition family protein [Thalassotalea sp. PS06]|uniref:peptidoglycan recognition protein family protein n=1 Tax=Thalassotalea sp. PS06 TaxID=2594005 RepID=UPI001164675F|nr:peptidoglycan recognition family protein [Thalassotalea sp. PS06]QDP01962.1 N-acetylmuramoyl-L-alanine amidase [Thalassotalea sp. PS06]